MTAAYFFNRNWDKKEKESKRVVITGIGAVTPLGNSVDETWKNVVKGKSGIGPITIFDASKFPVKIGAEVKNFDFEDCSNAGLIPFLGRGTKFCLSAVKEALNNAKMNLELVDTSKIGISLGANEEYTSIDNLDNIFEASCVRDLLKLNQLSGGNSLPLNSLYLSKNLGKIWPLRRSASMAASILSLIYNIHGPVSTSSSACVSSAQAIGKAMRMIQDGDAEAVITGGCDSIIGEIPLSGFYRIKALSTNNENPQKSSRPFDLKRDGFVLGEGSGILILEELSHAKERNAEIFGEIVGYASSSNAYRITASPEDGRGADICIKSAMKEAGCSIEDIDYINAHGTSTYLNDKSETVAIKKVFKDRAYEVPVSSNKSMLGHLVASAASIELILSVLTIKNSLIPPTINYENPDPECDLDYVPNNYRMKDIKTVLSNSFAFGGQNASIVVKNYK